MKTREEKEQYLQDNGIDINEVISVCSNCLTVHCAFGNNPCENPGESVELPITDLLDFGIEDPETWIAFTPEYGELKCPFPYFGGKTKVADKVWEALGDCLHYMEPFCGSCAVLWLRPNYNPLKHLETINDADGHIANVWRSMKHSPKETAEYAINPVNHADLSARRRFIIQGESNLLQNLIADPYYHDPEMAGFYIYCMSIWIGSGLTTPPKNEGRIGKRPHLANNGRGVMKIGQRPHLSRTGMGICGITVDSVEDWFQALSDRLRRVRVTCGDWKIICNGKWQDFKKPVGIFFDPPYGKKANRTKDLYGTDSLSVMDEVIDWSIERGKNKNYRIVIASYIEEGEELLNNGWNPYLWKNNGGYGNQSESTGRENAHREALFFSPYCFNQENI